MKHRKGDLSRRSFLFACAGGGSLALARGSGGSPLVRGTGRGGADPLASGLSLPPFLARPTTDSVLVSVRNGPTDAVLRLDHRPQGSVEWRSTDAEQDAGPRAFVDWRVSDLAAGTAHEYRILAAVPGEEPRRAARGSFTTQRLGEVGFTAALIADPHAGSFVEGSEPLRVLDEVVRNVRADRPDFVIGLGDNVAWTTSRDLPQLDDSGAIQAYTTYRSHLAPLSASCPHFGLIGNWEGESGKFSEKSTALVREVRKTFAPNPDHRTYPQGGSPDEDYYAFDWGPALFVVLNVQSYTEPSGERRTSSHDVSFVEDWTLGEAQLSWLEEVLGASDRPFRFLCVHHPVGGNAATRSDTLYGRGGPRAASVGEQRRVHEMMREFGVQVFFFGHDHVFLDEVVDGIHYALPGSCGAPWKFGREVTGYERFWEDSGHGRLTVRPDRARVEFVSRTGEVLHRFDVEPA